MNNLKDLCKIGECKTALDTGFTFEFYEDDGNTESSGYYVNVYKEDEVYKYVESDYCHNITYEINEIYFGEFCEKVINRCLEVE